MLIRSNPLLVIERPFKSTPNPEINHSRRSACQSEAGDSLRLLRARWRGLGERGRIRGACDFGRLGRLGATQTSSQLVEEPVEHSHFRSQLRARELSEEREAWKRGYKDARAKFKEEHPSRKLVLSRR